MPLILRKAQGNRPGDWGADDYDVKSGEYTVGRIFKVPSAPPNSDKAWYWAINGLHAGPGVIAQNGYVATRDDGMEALAMNWRKWLAWAALKEID